MKSGTNNNSSGLLKRGFVFSLFSGLNNGLSFLLIFILSFFLSKEDFGILNLFNVLIMIVSAFISLGTQSYLEIAFFRTSRENFILNCNVIIAIAIVVSFVFGTIALCIPIFLKDILGFGIKYQIFAIAFCFFQLFYSIVLGIYRYEEKIFSYGIFSILWAGLNFFLTVMFCISFRNGWAGRAIAQLLSAFILFIISLFILYRNNYLRFIIPPKKFFVDVLKFGLPLLPHGSSIWMRQGLDRYINNIFHGPAVVGIYSFAYNLSGLLLMLGTAFNQSNSVFIFKNLSINDNNTQNMRKIFSKQIYMMIIVFGSISIMGYISSILFINIFIPKYIDAKPYLFPLFVSAFFQCIYYLFVNYLFYFQKTKQLMYITFSISIIHFLLSIMFTRYSSLYTAYISLFSTFLICCSVVLYANKIYPLFNFKNLLREKI